MPTPKGSKLSPEHRRKISEGLKNSEKHKAGIRNRKLINPFEGHNYGECNKCGKTHIHPMKGKHHSEETKRKISNANRGKKRTLEQRQKLSKALKGGKGSWEGKHLSSAHKLNIARGLRNSKLFHERVREYHRRRARENEEEVKDFLRELYDISEKAVFYPASKYEHQFARRVLIQGCYSRGFITQSGLNAHAEWVKNNQNENVDVPVVL